MIDWHWVLWGVTAAFWFLTLFAVFEDTRIVLPAITPPPVPKCPRDPMACTRREYFRLFYLKNRLRERMFIFGIFGAVAAFVAMQFPPLS